MQKLTFKNTFHNTTCTVLGEVYEDNIACQKVKRSMLPYRKLLKIEKTLCGIKDCHCQSCLTWAETKDGTQVMIDYKYNLNK